MSDTESENTLSLGEFIADLKHADPEMGEVLETLLNDYEDIALKHGDVIKRRKDTITKYFKSEKGKEATRRASKKYYDTKIKSGRPVGRPCKNNSLDK